MHVYNKTVHGDLKYSALLSMLLAWYGSGYGLLQFTVYWDHWQEHPKAAVHPKVAHFVKRYFWVPISLFGLATVCANTQT